MPKTLLDRRCEYCNKPEGIALTEKPYGKFKVCGAWCLFCSTQCKHAFERRYEAGDTADA